MKARPPYAALFLVSASALSLQIAAMRVFSITQWSHFISLIISAALLGFGASGTFLAVFKNKIIAHQKKFVFITVLLCALTAALAVLSSVFSLFAFDSYLIFASLTHKIKLALNSVMLFFPFFFAALFIGFSFITHSKFINKIYFFNLLGSGAGAVFPLLIINYFYPQKLFPIIAFLPLFASLLLFPETKRKLWGLCFTLTAAVIFFFLFFPLKLNMSEYKGISYALNLKGSEIISERPTVYGFMQHVKTPHLRYAPGISLNYKGEIPQADRIYINGDILGAVFRDKDDYNIFDHTVKALPYKISFPENALFLDDKTFSGALYARCKKVKYITSVSPAAFNAAAMRCGADYGKKLKFKIKAADPRTYLYTTKEKYDLITMPPVDVFGGASGLFALNERYLLTAGSMAKILALLNDDGIFYVSAWMDYPLRVPLKILSTLTQTLFQKGLLPEKNMAVIRDWGMVHFIVKKTPFSKEQIQAVENFCAKNMFDIDFLKGVREEGDKYNHPGVLEYYDSIKKIISPQREEFYEAYKFKIAPAADNNPYFFHFLKLRHAKEIIQTFGARSFAFTELGYLIAFFNFIQALLASALLIILPLFYLKKKLTGKFYNIIYFSSLGLGFMFLEMVFIQKFSFYFGSPVYSAAFVIAFMLIVSGAGSYVSGKIYPCGKNIFKICLTISLIIIFYSFFLDKIFYNTVSFHMFLKILISFIIITPAAFLMGMPFPSALSLTKRINAENIPWCWGINGCFSVIAASAVILISAQTGFFAVMLLSAFFYAAAALVNLKQ